MTATFTFREDRTLSRTLKIPVTVQELGEQFAIEPKEREPLFLIAETGQMKGKSIQPENAKFLKLEDGQKYEVVAAPRDKCYFVHKGRTISMVIEKVSSCYLGERFSLNDVTLKQGEVSLPEVNGEFKNLIKGETYTVEGTRKNIWHMTTRTTEQARTSRFIKIEVFVPDDVLGKIKGALLEDYQTTSNIRSYKYLNELFDNQAAMNKDAQNLMDLELNSDIPEFRTFFSGALAITAATESVFQDTQRRLNSIFISVMQLPKSLLEAIILPNGYENNVQELRKIMENRAETCINETVKILGTEIEAIVSGFQKPSNLAKQLCTIVFNQIYNSNKEKEKVLAVLKSKQEALAKLHEEAADLSIIFDSEQKRVKKAEHTLKDKNGDHQTSTFFSYSPRIPPSESYESNIDAKLKALLEFVKNELTKKLPTIDQLDNHNLVNQKKYVTLLNDIHSQEPFVLAFRSYVTLLAKLTSATATNDDYMRLRILHDDLDEEAKNLDSEMDQIYQFETETDIEKAKVDKKVADEKIEQCKLLIQKNSAEIAKIEREIEQKISSFGQHTKELEALRNVNRFHLHIQRLIQDILTGLSKTKEYIEKQLKSAISDFMLQMTLPVAEESENDARRRFETYYKEAITVIGWAVQIATSSLVFNRLYEKVISPGLKRNIDALYCPELHDDDYNIANATVVIEELQLEIPRGTFEYIQTLNKPFHVVVEALTQGESPSDPEQSKLPVLD